MKTTQSKKPTAKSTAKTATKAVRKTVSKSVAQPVVTLPASKRLVTMEHPKNKFYYGMLIGLLVASVLVFILSIAVIYWKTSYVNLSVEKNMADTQYNLTLSSLKR